MSGDFVARWDLDKTYLRTDFDTLRDLIRTAVERPDRKRSVPGAAALLRELGQTGARVHILSGSPRQMRGRLEEKLIIDRVRWDELTLKPNLSNLLRLRLKALREQLGYKLPVLLAARVRDQKRSTTSPLREILVGDDAEADAFVYSLYADVCSGDLSNNELKSILVAGELYRDQAQVALDALRSIEPVSAAVQRILIHLDRQTPPSRFDDYGARVVPFYNYLQAAFVLAEDGRLSAEAVLRVASDFALRHRFDADALARSYRDLMRRGHAQGTLCKLLPPALEGLDPGVAAKDRLLRMCELINQLASEKPTVRVVERRPLDYVELAHRHRGSRNRTRRR